MRRIKQSLLVLTAGLIVVAVLTACEQARQGGGGQDGGEQEQQIDIQAITEGWAESAHADAVTFAAEETFCAGCHDGGAFATGTANPDDLGRDFIVATDCRACHTGRGAELMASGEVTITTATQTINARAGAVCLGCHRSLGRPDDQNPERNGPHASSQGDVWYGTGGFIEGLEVTSTEPHRSIRRACVTCHMADTEGGPTHTMRVDPDEACGRSGCHDNVEGAPNLPAREDYDGNGQTEGIQDEVANLQAIVTSATLEAAQATTITEEQGRIVLRRGNSSVGSFSPEVYRAAYNLLLTEVDGSRGVHNPAFVVSLLQQTYRELTGREITNAVAPR